MAQAGGKDVTKIEGAIAVVRQAAEAIYGELRPRGRG